MVKWNGAAFSVYVIEKTVNTDQCCQFHVSNAVTTNAITLPFPSFFFIQVPASDAMWLPDGLALY